MRNSEQHRALMYEFEYMGKARIDQLAPVRKERGSKHDGTIQGLSRKDFVVLHGVAKRAQSFILEYQALHGSVENLRTDVIEHMRMSLYPEKDVMPRVAAYALTAGTSRLPEVIKLLHEELKPEDLIDVARVYAENCHKTLQGNSEIFFQSPLPVDFILNGGSEAYKALYPNLMTAAAYQIVEKAQAGQLPGDRLAELLELLGNDDDSGKKWSKRVVEDIRYLIGQRPVKALEDLRKNVTGTSTPSNSECSQRIRHAIRSIMAPGGMPASEGTYEEYAEVIRRNDFYYDKLLVQDLTSVIKQEVDDNEDNPSQDFDYGVESWVALSTFLKILKLSDEEISVIALMAVRDTSLGSAYDQAQENPAIGALSMAALLFPHHAQIKEQIETDVKKCIAFGLWQSMSQFAMGQALQHDAGKFILYKLTNNRLLLNGLKNRSLLDTALGTDLGL